jgi:dipeptidyl aminopeptidase/acylaminoacyl peptidase
LVAIGSGWFAVAANNEQQLAQTGTRLEQTGTFALSRFESDQIEALLRALKTGQELQAALTGAGIPIKAVSEYPATSPIFTLQQLQASLPNSLLLAHTDIITSATFSPQGDRAVTVSLDGTARVWDLKTGASTPLEGYTDSVTSATFSPQGDRVVTASYEGTARVWDLKTGASTTLEGHTDRVTSATFSPEGDRVVTASLDGTARVWDLNGRQLALYKGYFAMLSPDGQRVASVIHSGAQKNYEGVDEPTLVDGRAQVYDLDTLPELITWGCQWLHNYLEYGQATDADAPSATCRPAPPRQTPLAPSSHPSGGPWGWCR